MELYDESIINKKNKNKKLANIILICIILIFILIISILILMIAIKNSTLTVSLNGQTNDNLKSVLIFEDNNSKIYVPIKRVATFFGYNSYNGDYEQPSEDISKCYVQSENEVASFSLNSDIIYKTIPNSNSDYEYFKIDEPVKSINGELYTTVDGIEKAFNITFSKTENNKIQIYTLDYLIQYYSGIITNYGYTSINSNFNNEKAVLNNMLVVEKDRKYGVINSTTGETLLDTKYDEIKYLQHTSDFLVTSNRKVGIISSQKETKIDLIYEDIELMDYDSNLYIIKQDNKYGVIDINGSIKIYPEYTKIGIDSSYFKYNDIKNGYILLDTLIPVQKDRLWGLFDKSGKQVVDFKYDNLGYIQNSSQNANNLLVIPEYNVIVVRKDNKYNLIDISGREVFKQFVDSIYMKIESGNAKYYMTYNNQTSEVSNYLNNLNSGERNNNTNNNNSTSNTNVTNSLNNNNTVINVNVSNNNTNM